MDAGLRKILSQNLREAQWTPVETGATAQGVPDAEFCFPRGRQGWVECKRSLAWAVVVRPEQIGWHLKRARLGGRSFVAVRRLNRGADELWLAEGARVAEIAEGGLRNRGIFALVEAGGPEGWDWAAVRAVLEGR